MIDTKISPVTNVPSKRTEDELLAFVQIMRFYAIEKGNIQSHTAFLFIEEYIKGNNPFKVKNLLRRLITDLQEAGEGQYYLSNDYINPNYDELYQTLWAEIRSQRLQDNDEEDE